MVRRLIRWELSLISYVQSPPQSTVLDEIAFNRAFLGVGLFKSVDTETKQMSKALESLINAKNVQTTGRCFDKSEASGEGRLVLLTAVYNHTLMINNILNFAGRNNLIILTAHDKDLSRLWKEQEFGGLSR
jgi:hypothetical protein